MCIIFYFFPFLQSKSSGKAIINNAFLQYEKAGCQEKLASEERVEHERVCKDKKPCFASKCQWRGLRQELVAHLEEDHLKQTVTTIQMDSSFVV